MFEKQKRKFLKHFRKKTWFTNFINELYLNTHPTLDFIGNEYNRLGERIFEKYDKAIARSLLNKAVVARETNLLDPEQVSMYCLEAARLNAQDEPFFESVFEILARYSSGTKLFEDFLFEFESLNYKCINKALLLDYIQNGNCEEAKRKIEQMSHDDQLGCLARIPVLVPYLNKVSSDEIAIYNELKDNKYKSDFLALLKSEDVCVVGNSPCELGKGKGEKIDSFKHVLRFNYFSTDKKFLNDYGKKTTIWVRNSSIDPMNKLPEDLEYIVFGSNILYSVLSESVIAELPKLFSNYKVCFLDGSEVGTELLNQTGLKSCSLGLHLSSLIYKLKGTLESRSLFGFSFIDQLKDRSKRHYFKSERKTRFVGLGHEWELERDIFDKMIAGDNIFD